MLSTYYREGLLGRNRMPAMRVWVGRPTICQGTCNLVKSLTRSNSVCLRASGMYQIYTSLKVRTHKIIQLKEYSTVCPHLPLLNLLAMSFHLSEKTYT